ncbi:MAG: AAA family ATPase [Methanothrix sp.]|nr:AAA family ATPase [Methanothrix sp.]
MITSFSLKNFKSYREAHMPLATLTFFIGPNASGKSNALEAIRLLSWMAKGSRLDDIERSIQGSDSLLRGRPVNLFLDSKSSFEVGCRIQGNLQGNLENWNTLSVSISLIDDHLIITDESVSTDSEPIPLYSVDSLPNPLTDEIRVAYNNFKRGRNKPHIPCSNRQAIFYQLGTPARFEKSDEKSQKVIPAAAKRFRHALREIVFLDPQPALMRGYSFAKDNEMKENGSNLSSVLYNICEGDGPLKKDLLDFVRSLPEQDIKDINFIVTDRNDVMVVLKESFGNKDTMMDAPVLSDGTLRVLATGATLLSASPGSLVIIEEIDNGVHPSRAELLIKQIIKIGKKRKLNVLLTSHNPALLDALPDESLGDVLCCYRDPELGDSRIVRLGDLDRFPELMAQGSLGQLVTRQILDRFLKDKTTPEERKQAALSWLEELKKGVTDECHLSD